MITEDYISFETAKLLKEKGFQQIQDNCGYFTTDMVYSINADKEGKHHFAKQYPAGVYNKDKYIAAPTHQMAMKWLREVYKIHIIAEPCLGEGNEPNLCFNRWFWTILIESGEYKPIRKIDEFPTYEEACENATKYCLKNLI